MAAVCEICGKGPGFGKSVSHSHRRTSRRWDPNVQTVHVVTRPGGKNSTVREPRAHALESDDEVRAEKL